MKSLRGEGVQATSFGWKAAKPRRNPSFYSYYNVLTGKKLYVSNFELLKVEGDGDGPQARRYVAFGYIESHKFDQPPQLQYGTDKQVAQRFSLVSAREYYDAPQMYVATNEQLEKSLDLRGSPRGFVIVLKYLDGFELRIPVEDDITPRECGTSQGLRKFIWILEDQERR